MPAIIVMRRTNVTSSEVEVVRIGSRRVRARRPAVTDGASIPQGRDADINIPAAHEVEQDITNFIVRYVQSKTYTSGIGFAKD